VVIGNANYRNQDVPAVAFAHNDAATMRRYLVESFGFLESNVVVARDADLSRMLSIFGRDGNEKGELFNRLARDSMSDVFVFYSGHGAPEPNTAVPYLMPVDANPQQLALTAYSLRDLYGNLAKLPARSVTVVLDACFSGVSDRGALIKGISPGILRTEMPLFGRPNALILTASAANQVSAWDEYSEHGLFSYNLFLGMKGDADADQNGEVAVGELVEFITERVAYESRKYKAREQTPQAIGSRTAPLLKFATAGSTR
jgi:hypothetical protein